MLILRLRRSIMLMMVISCALCGCRQKGGDSAQSQDLSTSLEALEALFAGVPTWLATVYDSSSGGFYHNALMAETDSLTPDLQSTSFSLNVLFGGNIVSRENVSEAFRDKMIRFVIDRYDERESYFLDPAYKERTLASDRTLSRMQGMAASILHRLDATDTLTRPFEVSTMPPHLRSLSDFKAWLEHQPWERVWSAFDRIAMQYNLIRRLPPERADSILQYIQQYAEALQDDDGLWGAGQPMEVRFSGAAKYGTFCMKAGIDMPNADKTFETVINWLGTTDNHDFSAYSVCPICVPRNALRVLYYTKPYLKRPITAAERRIIVEKSTAMLDHYRNTDGGFMKNHLRSDVAPNDIDLGTAKTLVSDMNGTHLAVTTRSAVYDLLDLPVPQIPADPQAIRFVTQKNVGN